MFTEKQANLFVVLKGSVKQTEKKYCRVCKSSKTPQAVSENFQHSRTNSHMVLVYLCNRALTRSNSRYDVMHDF